MCQVLRSLFVVYFDFIIVLFLYLMYFKFALWFDNDDFPGAVDIIPHGINAT